jgi:hypothetical protein
MITALAAIKYLGEFADRLFEARMQSAAIKIRIHSDRLPR